MNIYEQLPAGLLDLPANKIHQLLDGPSLFMLPGRLHRPLFVAVLQHGNEYSGWEAIRILLKEYGDRPLPRTVALFISNVQAARHCVRHLDNQPDFNRCWPGAACDNETAQLFRQVTDFMREQKPVASIDIHNNTSQNPLYSVINRHRTDVLKLATHFAPMAVLTHYPKGTQSDAFADFCPSVSLECSQAGDELGIERARSLVALYLRETVPDPLVKSADMLLYRMRARISVPRHIEVAPLPEEAELRLAPDLEQHNFRCLPRATVLGQTDLSLDACLYAEDGDGQVVTNEFFELNNGALRTKQDIIPGMFTADPIAIQRDCLGYIMEPIAAE